MSAAHPAAARRIRLLGGEVDLVTPAEVIAFVADCAAHGRKALVANHNLHSLVLQRRSEPMRRCYALASLIEADSTPMIAWGRLLGLPISRRHRATYLDWRKTFWAMASAKRWRVFYLGGAPGVAARAAEQLRGRWPGATVGVRDGYFDLADASVVEAVNVFRPDVLLVGMGMPRQEAWIAAHYDRLSCGAVLPVGAAFDYEAGIVPTPPRWAGRLGVEWLFRLCAEPGRLAHRYLVEPWALAPAAIQDVRAALARRRTGPLQPA